MGDWWLGTRFQSRLDFTKDLLCNFAHYFFWLIFKNLFFSLCFFQSHHTHHISPYEYIFISTYLTYIFICAVLWCGLWLWPCLSGCPVLAESRYPHTCTHTYWHICIYIYIYKLNTHTTQGLGAVLASRFGRDHQLVCLVMVSNERRARDECTPSTLFRDIVFNQSLNTY